MEHPIRKTPNAEVYREMVESLDQMVWMCRASDGACTYLSPRWIEYTGVPVDEQLGYGWLEQLHPDDVNRTKREWERCARAGEPLAIEFRIRNTDGEFGWFQTRATPVRNSAGQVVNWVGSNTDVTALKRMQVESNALNDRLEHLVSERTRKLETVATQLGTAQRLAQVGSWELDVRTNEVTWSRELFRVFGLDAKKGAPSYDVQQSLFTERSWEQLNCAIAHSIDTGEGYELNLEVLTCKEDQRRAVARAAALRGSDGQVERLVGTFQDITERELEKEELNRLNKLLAARTEQAESANAAKSTFVANVSHDIRTPLGAILGVSYLLRRTTLTSEQDELLSSVELSAKSLQQIINDILDLSKIEAGQLSLDLAPFDLRGLGQELRGLMRGYALGKPIKCQLSLDVDLPEQIVADRVRVIQMLTNLVGNAIKFTDEGSVHVELSKLDRGERTWLRGEVRDTGLGIEASALEQVFQPFAQVDDARNSGGTGLGLTIVRQLAQMMGGTVDVQSTPGAGSTFWFEVPVETTSKTTNSDGEHRLRVLVVDENESERKLLTHTAQNLGWDVVEAESGNDALEKLKESPNSGKFDAILLDWVMPEMDGVEMVREMKKSFGAEANRWGVVMATARSVSDLSALVGPNEVDAVLEKPLTETLLFDALLGSLARRAETHERVALAVRGAKNMKRLQDLRVLAVDDSPINRELARRVLEQEGASVDLANDGVEALVRLRACDAAYDAVLLDVQMPRMDGITAVRKIRRELQLTDLPVFALTAGAQAEDRAVALEAGMTEFITKPFQPEDLIAKIRSRVARRGRKTASEPRPSSDRRPRTWPQIPGIDAAEAQSRFGGDEALFLELLKSFRRELQDAAGALRSREETTTLGPLLHQVCGSAGNVGAKTMARLARQADETLRPGAPRDQELLNRVADEATELIAAIDSVRLEDSRTPVAS